MISYGLNDMYYEHYEEQQKDGKKDNGRYFLPYMLERMNQFKTDAMEKALKECGFTCVGGSHGGFMMVNMQFKRYYNGYTLTHSTQHVGEKFYTLDLFVSEVFNPFGSELKYVEMLIADKEYEIQQMLEVKRNEKKALEEYVKCIRLHPEMTEEFSRIRRQNDCYETIQKINYMLKERSMTTGRDCQGRPSILSYVPGERDR